MYRTSRPGTTGLRRNRSIRVAARVGMRSRVYLWAVVALAVAAPVVAADTPRPNVLLVLADDLGYSDLGCYGGEIDTPALDRLAAHRLRFPQFYNRTPCCPPRASPPTRPYPHPAGGCYMDTHTR